MSQLDGYYFIPYPCYIRVTDSELDKTPNLTNSECDIDGSFSLDLVGLELLTSPHGEMEHVGCPIIPEMGC